MHKHLTFIAILIFSKLSLLGAQGIPEPMLFDMIRPLDSKKGELEINTLVHKGFDSQNSNKNSDPFGSGATTYDNKKVEWAPEIEYAVADGFALEFELPMEGTHLEAYKFGAQYTFGRVSEAYIHGVQLILEPNKDLQKYNTSLLYLGGYRFNETFSSIFMLGGRMDLEGPQKEESFEYLANGSLFAELNHTFALGLETNYSTFNHGEYALTLVPQLHYDATETIELQAGLSFGDATYAQEKAFIFRAIYCFH